jgi:hypothetical protein
MKKYYYLLILLFASFHQGFSKLPGNGITTSGCSVAGTPSLSNDSICFGDTTTLILTGYNGAIQWQSFDGTNWNNETGVGAITDHYDVATNGSTDYRAVVTASGCPSDTSVSITLTVGTLTMPYATDITRCGPGQVTFTGTGANILQWFDVPSGGTPLGSGSPFTTYVPASGTYYLENSSFGGGSGGASPILVSEMDLDDNGSDGDNLEIINVAPFDVDVTGWKVAVGDDYTNINVVNAVVNTLSGTLTPGQTITWDDAGVGNYWGSNLLWTGSSPADGGWVAIIDAAGEMRDFAVWGYSATDIQNASLSINGTNYSLATEWIGDPIDNTAGFGTGLNRIGNMDHDDKNDWTAQPLTLGSLNTNMSQPFLGLGCSSPRYAIQVTVTASDSVVANTTADTICRNDMITLSASSINAGYTYTWSPDSSLSSTTGSSVTATPQSDISYIVIGDDGTCSNRDTVTVSVIQHSSGVPAVSVDTVCSGNPTILSLAGYIGTIQWQSNDGNGWINETGIGSTSDFYIVHPLVNSQYRALVAGGQCPDDTSAAISVAALIPADPILNDTTVCAPSIASIPALSNGTVAWYTDSAGPNIYIGNPLITNITGNTTFYAATMAGSVYEIGALTNAIGNVTQLPAAGWGLQFDVSRPCILTKVYVYPAQTGNLTIDLRDSQGGTILATKTIAVTASNVKVPVNLEWGINPASGYRLELGAGSVSLKYNFTGASYPYSASGSPVSIEGFCNPAFSFGGVQYLFFYDWQVLEGCISNRVPVNVSTIPGPATPTITQQDSLLTSSAATGNQWYLGGNLIPGATNATYNMTQTGIYQVVVSTPNGCTAAASINVTVLGIDELNSVGISVYPNPVSNRLNILFTEGSKNDVKVKLMQVTGATVFESRKESTSQISIETGKLATGTYLLEIQIKDAVYRKMIMKD